jgi:PAS domain S-box-containing protein
VTGAGDHHAPGYKKGGVVDEAPAEKRAQILDGADAGLPEADGGESPSPLTVLILAASNPEASAAAAWLGEDGIRPSLCPTIPALVQSIESGAAMAVLSEEALRSADFEPLSRWLGAQPSWSDFPFVILTERSGEPEADADAIRRMRDLGNVTFLKRPFPPMTFVSLVRTGLASRRRQYEARDQLEKISAAEERLSFALKAGHLGAWELALPGYRLNASAIFKGIFGRAEDETFSFEALVETVHAEDRRRLRRAIEQSLEDGPDFDVECRLVTPEGDLRWAEVRGRARYDEGGQPLGLAGVALDITGRKEAEERQNLLMRELHHRVKNTLATVQAIVGSTARSAKSIEDFYEAFGARIASLAHTHDLLTEEFWQMASLRELLSKELDHYEDRGSKRIRLKGPSVQLYSDIAVPIGMALHELTTNAAKYGALSIPDGQLDVTWRLETKDGRQIVFFDWIEKDGPEVEVPRHRGFGTRLLDRVLTAQVHAEIALEFEPGGFHFSMNFPLLPTKRAF